MKSYEMDMCTGSLWKKIMVFSVTLMFSNILHYPVHRHFARTVQRRQCLNRTLYRGKGPEQREENGAYFSPFAGLFRCGDYGAGHFICWRDSFSDAN